MKKHVTVSDGTSIHYRIYGTGYPLVLLHGNNNTGAYFHEQIPDFAHDYQVITIDSRAHGKSTNQAQALTYRQMAHDVATVLAHEGIHQAHVLGFSDGANIAMWLACDYPTLITRLILNAGNTTVKGLKPIIRWITYVQYAIYWVCALVYRPLRERLPLIALMLHDSGLTTEDLARINIPTLVIVSKHDYIRLSHSLYITQAIPQAKLLLLSKKGHHLAQRAPTDFNKTVLSFFKETKV